MSLLAQLNLPAPRTARTELSPRTFADFRAFIYEKTGIYFQENKSYLLESRLARRISALGMPSYEAYLRYLQSPGGQRELNELYNAVTINETAFFRTPAQFDVLERELLPEIALRNQKQSQRRIRFWSAACSSGDEPYSMAMLVREKLQPRFPQVQFEIIGTDLNTEVIRFAQEGIYGERTIRNIPPDWLKKHFRHEDGRYILSPEIRRMVSFRQMNLFDQAAMGTMRGFDVIMCANVLIYFDQASKQEVVSSLYHSLNPGGYLFVGFSETLYGVTQALQPVRFEKTIAYKKG